MMNKLLTAVLLAGVMAAHSSAEWKTLTADDGLSGNEVQFLRQDDDGTIWIGTLAGLSRYKDGELQTFVEGTAVWDVLKIGHAKYLIGAQNGVLLADGDKREWKQRGLTVVPIYPYNHTVWMVGKSHRTEEAALFEKVESEWQVVGYFKDKRVVDLFRTGNGHLWVVSDGNGLYEVDPAKGPEASLHHLQGLNVTALAEDSAGRAWVGLWGRGVRVLEDGRWQTHIPNEDGAIFSMIEDSNKNIWVATSSHGLWQYDGNEWKNHLRAEGGVNMLAATSDGKVWISTQTKGGLRYWDGETWKVSLESFLPIRCLLETKSGEIWAGGILDGLHILKK